MKTKISIIVPVYNAENCIERAVMSLLNQEYKDLEIILINDGSTDESLKKCEELKEKDKRIIVIDKPNTGISSTRNIGIDNATGEFITFIDSDDYVDSKAYKNCMDVFNKYNIDLLKFSYYKESKHNKVRYDFKTEAGKIINIDGNKDFLLKNIFDSKDFEGIWNLIVKKELIDRHRIRFDENLIVAEDFRFMTECLAYAKNIYILNTPFYHYVINVESITQKYDLIKTIKRCDSIISSYIESSKKLGKNIKDNEFCIKKILDQLFAKSALIAEHEKYAKFKESINKINELKSFNLLKEEGNVKNIPSIYSFYIKLKLKNKIKTIAKRIVYR